jgi:hypothetical protein
VIVFNLIDCNSWFLSNDNDLQNITQKTKDRSTRTPHTTRGELGCSGWVGSFCSTCGTRCVALVCRSVFVLFLWAIVLSVYGFWLPQWYLQTFLIHISLWSTRRTSSASIHNEMLIFLKTQLHKLEIQKIELKMIQNSNVKDIHIKFWFIFQ